MSILIVLSDPKGWPLAIPGVEVVSARSYLTDPRYSEMRGAKVFNLSRSFRYQSAGYYVSLLAEARGHRPMPTIGTIQDLKSATLLRVAGEELDELIQQGLMHLQASEFELSIYFGHNLVKRYEKLSHALFNLFPAPLLKAEFVRKRKWQLQNIGPIATSEIPETHRDFVAETAKKYFEHRKPSARKQVIRPYDMAILVNPEEENPPSDQRALKRIEKAAESMGFNVDFLTRDDSGRVAEFDALFIRETTSVNHHTYRIARKAQAQGTLVIDDPVSILRCTNKVYLFELLNRHKIAIPKTRIIHKGNMHTVLEELGLPCVLKQPDSSFSQGVAKADTHEEYYRLIDKLFKKSDLIIGQEFLPTPFDWRVGVFDRKPIYVCRYYMAGKHWQVIQRTNHGSISRQGRSDALRIEDAPKHVVDAAVRAANLIGDGLYGVDLKEINGEARVIEVNDNPNIDSGVEDVVLGDELYRNVIQVFLNRLDAVRTGKKIDGQPN